METNIIKHTNTTPITLYIMTEKFAMFLPKNTFSAAKIQKFFIFRKTNVQDILVTVTW